MSLFKKIVSKIFNQEEEEADPNVTKLADKLRDADLDYKFAQLFTHSGGFFNYCADESEALQTLNQIVKLEHIKSAFCWDKDLQSFLDVIETDHSNELSEKNDAAFITAEYLIAYDGRIMLSDNNIRHYHSSLLPNKIIILAHVSQIVANLSDAMMKVKRGGNPRKNLTSISGSQSKLGSENKDNTKLFLLLLED